MTSAWNTNAARQLIAVVMRPPISGPGGGADAAHPADHAERPRARRDVGEEHRGEDVDGRDQQRGADAFEDRVAEDQHAEARATPRSSPRRSRTRSRPAVKHRFRPHRSVSLPPGIIERGHHQQEDRDRVCTPWTVVSRSLLMSVIITFMFEPAKLQMNCASASGTSMLPERTGRSCRADVARRRASAVDEPERRRRSARGA